MLIYKYTSYSSGKLILEKGSLRFSQIEVLNDPFELSPSMSKFRQSISEFVRNSAEFREMSATLSPLAKELLIEKIVKPSIVEVERLTKENLIFSLTKREDNNLMWAHYANSYAGIVIGFDFEHDFFHQKANPYVTCAYDVVYSDKIPEFFDFRNFLVGNILVEDYRQMLLTKSLEWSYEEEVRLFASPLGGKNVGRDGRGFELFLYEFPKECIKKIILGCEVTSEETKELSEVVERVYPHAELFVTTRDTSSFKLNLSLFKR